MIAMNTHQEALLATTPTVPSLQKHHDGRSWTSYWRDDRKQLRTKRLGKEEKVTERQARARWHQWKQSEWTKPHVQNPESDAALFSGAMLAKMYREYAAATFVKNGAPTSHLCNVNQAMNELEREWADMPLQQKEASDLVKLRDKMIRDDDGKIRSLSTVNGRLSIIKAALVWGSTERSYFPASKAHEFSLVKPLRKRRCEAKLPKKVKPVPDADRLAAQAKMPTVLRDMTEVERLTGMRSGELITMRGVNIDMSEDVWVYAPEFHKTEHFDHERFVAIGPQAQAIIKKYLTTDLMAYLFSPRAAQAERLEARRATRKVKLWPSHQKRRPCRPSSRVGERYTPSSYRRAIYYACKKAKIKPWHPHQLRHGYGTVVREEFGLEHAASGMGNSLEVAQIYAALSLKRGKEVARKVG